MPEPIVYAYARPGRSERAGAPLPAPEGQPCRETVCGAPGAAQRPLDRRDREPRPAEADPASTAARTAGRASLSHSCSSSLSRKYSLRHLPSTVTVTARAPPSLVTPRETSPPVATRSASPSPHGPSNNACTSTGVPLPPALSNQSLIPAQFCPLPVLVVSPPGTGVTGGLTVLLPPFKVARLSRAVIRSSVSDLFSPPIFGSELR